MSAARTFGTSVARPNDHFTGLARRAWRSGTLIGLALVGVTLVACEQQRPGTAAPLPPILPFDQAVANAANAVFTAAPQGSYRVVIDPLVDGVTGYTSSATEGIQSRVTSLVQSEYPRFSVERFSPETLKAAPMVLVGTFTPINSQNQTSGPRESYRFCLVLADLNTGRIVSKGVARAAIAGVDGTPTPVFRQSPVWTTDPATQAYISTCQASKVGDALSRDFLDGLTTAALISQGDEAFNAGSYQSALTFYSNAKRSPAGDQLKAYNGIYLSYLRLNQPTSAADAFGDAVGYGLRRNRLAVKFLFQPGSTQFYQDSTMSGQYPMWLEQIARQASEATGKSNDCIEVSGHTSRSGSSQINEQLSLRRAEFVKRRLETDAPQIADHLVTVGLGSSQMMVGTGKDDLSDALDRRVEFKPGATCR
jgi:outer membrane protein OmpA-like peptidoglycan-associated protein